MGPDSGITYRPVLCTRHALKSRRPRLSFGFIRHPEMWPNHALNRRAGTRLLTRLHRWRRAG